MSDATDTGRASAGALLRAAREKQGLHIAALAAAIKVTPRKLDALEHDRYDELPGATFTRALAQTVCRSLKIDPQPVLALLPQADNPGLDAVAAGSLNTPFRDRPGREDRGGTGGTGLEMRRRSSRRTWRPPPRGGPQGRRRAGPRTGAGASSPEHEKSRPDLLSYSYHLSAWLHFATLQAADQVLLVLSSAQQAVG